MNDVEVFSESTLDFLLQRHRCASAAELSRRWIIQAGKSFYVMGADGEYLRPITRGELPQSIMRDLRRVPSRDMHPSGIEWYKNKTENPQRKSIEEILASHCTVARGVLADMSRPASDYDAEAENFYEAVCPLADTAPVYHPQIAEWLKRLGGDQHEKLLDWIATLTRTDRPSCALALTGKPGAGKELLAQGLARRWRWARTPTELGRIVDHFNEDLTSCPLVFCDENLPSSHGRKMSLADLRSMIAQSTRTLSRKFISNANLIGCIRLILAANNHTMFASSEAMTVDDQEANAVRFLHLKIGPEPAEYLRDIGGRAATEAWVAQSQIAEHAAWLERNRSVRYGARFIVEGNATEIQRYLLVTNKHTSPVLEWITHFLVADTPNSAAALAGNGRFLVNATTLSSNWQQYVKNSFAPTTTALGIALQTLSSGNVRVEWPDASVKRGARDVRYCAIGADLICEWALQNNVGDVSLLRQKLDAAIDMDMLKKKAGSTDTTAASPIPNVAPGATGLFASHAH